MKGICETKRSLFFVVLVLSCIMTLLLFGVIQQDLSKPIVTQMNRLFVTRPERSQVQRTNAREVERNQGIPKRIHQIWNDDMIPEVFQENIRGLVTHNKPPDWTYHFWTVQTGLKFIKDKYPSLEQRFIRADNLLKSDILRLAALHHYGGVYFDLDTVSVKPLDPYVETHTCSLVTDPPEHVFNKDRPTKMLLITNSAMLCKPSNWFIYHVIQLLVNQSQSCRDAISCTGPRFISNQYEALQKTNRSADLPIVDDFRYFEDMFDVSCIPNMNKHCQEPFPLLQHEWTKEVCREWISRGREKRNISEKAFTYHTWFHTYYSTKKSKLNAGTKRKIADIVPHVTFYPDS